MIAAPRVNAATLLTLSAQEREEFFESLTEEEAAQLIYDWEFWARANQRIPELGHPIAHMNREDWFAWLIISGRGFGKTRTGVETCRKWIEDHIKDPGPAGADVLRLALIAETAGDARDVIVEGESGIMQMAPPWLTPLYEPSKRRLTWFHPDDAALPEEKKRVVAIATTFAGKEPDQLRGPQFHKAWLDEFAKYQYPEETLDNLEMALRLGSRPQAIFTTTPRPLAVLKQLIKDPENVVTTGSSYENIQNLAPSYIRRIIKKYEGTRIGRQELHAEILDDLPGALWTDAIIDKSRLARAPSTLVRVVVAIDPAASSNEDSNETGISVCGLDENGHGHLLAEAGGIWTTGRWVRKAYQLYEAWGADSIVGEANNGGDMVEYSVKATYPNVRFKKVFASRGKAIRAAPIAGIHEQGRIHMIGHFSQLEDQLKDFDQEKYTGPGSPDRAESFIWGMTELFGIKGGRGTRDPKKFRTYRK